MLWAGVDTPDGEGKNRKGGKTGAGAIETQEVLERRGSWRREEGPEGKVWEIQQLLPKDGRTRGPRVLSSGSARGNGSKGNTVRPKKYFPRPEGAEGVDF